jgi:hypothetical protein
LYLAAAIPSAPEFRHEIREAIRTSAWMDEAGITREVESAFRLMCARAASWATQPQETVTL